MPTFTGTSGNDTLNGTASSDTIDGLSGADVISGNGGADILYGGDGDDIIHGEESNEIGPGDFVGAGGDTIYGGAGNDIIFGGAGNGADQNVARQDYLYGGDGDDRLFGGDGRVWEDGSVGSGAQEGVADFYDGGNGADLASIGLGGSIGSVEFDWSGPSNVASLIYIDGVVGGSVVNVETFSVSTGIGNDLLTGGSANDTITGGFGDDTIKGGAGNDTIVGSNGIDSLEGGEGNDFLDGGVDDDTLHGDAGNDFLDGGSGADYVAGGAGNDTYEIDDDDDQLVESADEGTDSVRINSGFSAYTLGANFENLYFFGAGDFVGAGNGLANIIEGWLGNDHLFGYGGDDILRGRTGADTLEGGDGRDQYFADTSDTVIDSGGVLDQVVLSVSGASTWVAPVGIEYIDVIISAGYVIISGDLQSTQFSSSSSSSPSQNLTVDGGLGAQFMTAGNGATVYVVDHAGDIVKDAGNSSGTDEVRTTIGSYTLDNSIENLTFQGTGNFQGAGNGSSNVITGGAGNDLLSGADGTDSLIGGDGNDTLNGGSGVDTLLGGDGNDSLDGGSGADSMAGGLGDDVYVVDHASDAVVELSGEGTDTIRTSLLNFSLAALGNIENLTYTGSSAFTGTGNSYANFLASGGGNDSLNGGAGDDSLSGAAGRDSLSGGDGNDTLDGGAGNDVLDGGAGNDDLHSGVGIDSLTGGDGDDNFIFENAYPTIDSSPVAGEVFNGGGGTDAIRVVVDAGSLQVFDFTGTTLTSFEALVFYAGAWPYSHGPAAAVFSGSQFGDGGLSNALTISSVLATPNFETGSITVSNASSFSAADWTFDGDDYGLHLEGTNGADNITAGAVSGAVSAYNGNDTLTGLFTGTTFNGGSGDDTFYANANIAHQPLVSKGDIFYGGSGFDTASYALSAVGADVWIMYSAQPYASTEGHDQIGADVEKIIGTNFADSFYVASSRPIASAQSVEGLDGADSFSFSGSVSEDLTLAGGAGNDIFEVTITFATAPSNIELIGGADNDTYLITLAMGMPQTAYLPVVTELANGGVDTVNVLNLATYKLPDEVENLVFTNSYFGGITLIGYTGFGNTLHNAITGAGAADLLNGGAGADTLDGGAGADSLIGGVGDDVYIVDDAGDVVTEVSSGNGYDRVQSSVTYKLSAHLEQLTLSGVASINGLGNELDNSIEGNAGNNLLNGGAGADTLTGGGGNDTYYVNDAGDQTIEASNQGTDSVIASVTWTLAANIENLTLGGSAGIAGAGNALDNVLTGNVSANFLNGGVGADTLQGGLGDDVYIVDNLGDVVVEAANEGTDLVRSAVTLTLAANVENLALMGVADIDGAGNALKNSMNGNAGNNSLSGGAGADTLNGAAGNDTLYGGGAADLLFGGAGQDVFVFNTALGPAQIDSVSDFVVADDTIWLDKAIFTKFAATGALSAAFFHVGATAADANDYIIYNSTTGALFYDSNGNAAGGSSQIATLSAGLALTAADFLII